MNLKKENDKGPIARAEPIADIKYNIPINTRVLFLPNLSFGIAPKIAPITVPHSAIDTTTNPWNKSEEFQSDCKVFSAPDITSVSKPNKKPARAEIIDHWKSLENFI